MTLKLLYFSCRFSGLHQVPVGAMATKPVRARSNISSNMSSLQKKVQIRNRHRIHVKRLHFFISINGHPPALKVAQLLDAFKAQR